MDNQRYFPPLYGGVECGECDMAAVCHSCGKYQRDRRDFTYTSGRCPRLPDRRGFVDKSQKKLYAETFPLVHAERGDESLTLSLSIRGKSGSKKCIRRKTDTGISVKGRRIAPTSGAASISTVSKA